MIISNIVNFNNSIQLRKPVSPTFTSIFTQKQDTFEKRTELFNMLLYSPFSDTYCHSPVKIKLSEPQTITLKNTSKHDDDIVVKYDPLKRGTLINKESGGKIPVTILESTQKHYDRSCAYHFVSPDLRKEYGYIEVFKPYDDTCNTTNLGRDYPEYGVVGKRLKVMYLKNYDDSKVGGIGKLADKVCVQYCLDNGFTPNIISYADKGSHVAHFKRGKRFIPPDKGTRL